MKFCFGKPTTHDSVVLEAKNKEHAIKLFKVSELFPEKCVDLKLCKDRDYDNNLDRYNYTFKIDNPKIYIYSRNNNDQDWKKIGYVFLKECIEVDYRNLIPQVNLLESPTDIKQEEPEETLPVIINAKTVSHVSSKTELRAKHDELARRTAELEAMVSELNEAMCVLHAEIKQKQKVIYIIETYLGIHEEVVQIADGISAPEETPLTLYQQKLYMDEEVGIWDDSDGQGLDFQQIEEFDKWIAKHYEKFVYEPLSIVVWQIRRNSKKYVDLWSNIQFNALNKTTYFLIRNGKKLYRIWSDVSVGDLLFPKKDEYVSLLEKEKEWGEDRAKEKLQLRHESYLYGLIAIQGMIERTDVLGTRLRQQRVNLLNPQGNPDELVKFIRDAETEYWIGDGQPRWNEFLKANQATICLGSRICLATEKYGFDLYRKDGDGWRCAPFHPGCLPQRDHCYQVEAFKNESKDEYFPHSTSILIRYHSGDCIGWDPYSYKEVMRKRRVPWFLYSDEVINFDEITLEQADYYMKSRLNRGDYLRILPTLHWVRRVKLREKELEKEFMKMIAGQLKFELTDNNKTKIQKAIDWWKLKNKWKRAITIKESTATRMILRRLKNNDKG